MGRVSTQPVALTESASWAPIVPESLAMRLILLNSPATRAGRVALPAAFRNLQAGLNDFRKACAESGGVVTPRRLR